MGDARLDDYLAFGALQLRGNLEPIGRDTGGAMIGALRAPELGTNHPVIGLPTGVALFPRIVVPAAQPDARS